MLKLLIVDDEENTREGLKRFVPWKELGIDSICEAEDGLTALAVFEREKPDILLCDVRMPRMYGIELSEKIKVLNPFCKIIFLSGFSDKEYLKSAIKIGAVDYIEKPVVLKELKAVLENTVKLCNMETESKIKEDLLNQKILNEMNYFKQELISKLIHPGTNFEILKQEIKDIYKIELRSEAFTAAVIQLKWNKSCEMSLNKTILKSIVNTIYEKSDRQLLNIFAGIINESTVIVVKNDEIYKNNTINDEFSEFIADTLIENGNEAFSYTVGIGKPVNSMELIHLSYQTALEAVKKQFFIGYGRVISYKDINNNIFVLDKSVYLAFESHLMEDDKDEAESIVHKLKTEMSRYWGTDIDHIKFVFLNLYLILCKVSNKRNLGKMDEENSKSHFLIEIYDFGTLHEIAGYLLEQMKSFFISFEDKDSTGQKVYEITWFIEKNYNNKNLSVQFVANNVHLSLNYMCGMFKKGTGKTVNDYIQEIRIQKACEFLKDRNIKLYEIADMVGIRDSNYFSRIFKKALGITPSVYREKYIL
jgi:two-component system, response regulator YesN